MNEWADLERRFRELEPKLDSVRIDYQWHDPGDREFWSLTGRPTDSAMRQFEALAQLAGARLMRRADLVPAVVLSDTNLARRWFRALWHMAGPHTAPEVASLTNEGEFIGHLFLGRICDVGDRSADLALKLQSMELTYPAPPAVERATPPSRVDRLSSWVEKESERRGKLWVVIGAVISLIVTILALW